MNISSFAITKVITTLPHNEDFALLPDGTMLMGNEGKLFSYKPGTDKDWINIADFTTTLKSFYRIAISPKGDQIALVAYTGVKP